VNAHVGVKRTACWIVDCVGRLVWCYFRVSQGQNPFGVAT